MSVRVRACIKIKNNKAAYRLSGHFVLAGEKIKSCLITKAFSSLVELSLTSTHMREVWNVFQLRVYSVLARRFALARSLAQIIKQFQNATENGTEAIEAHYRLQFTKMRQNSLYVQYYSLMGSCLVMVFIPVFILFSTYFMLKRNIPMGSTKRKTMRIMAVIIIMFIVCHMPKVIEDIFYIPDTYY